MSSRIAKVIAFAAAASGLIATTGVIQIGRAASGSLVAAYAFNEGSGTVLHDSTGNGNNGTVANATWVTTGTYGGALRFNGSNSRVTVPDSAALHLSSAMTLEAWVNPTSTSATWRDVIYKGNDNYYLEGTSGSGGGPAGGGTFGGANANAFASKKLTSNSWSFLAATYDGATLRLYVNGTLAASHATSGAITSSTSPLQIGGDSIYGQYFKGLIDQVRIYNTPLSATQIQADMTTPVGGDSTDTSPPSAPAGLAVSGVTQTAMTLSWNASSDNVGVSGYRLYLNGSQVGTSLTTSYLFSGLTCGTGSTLGVAAVDAANNLSGIATVGQQTAACPDTTPPSAPGTVSASAVSPSEVDLSWAAASDNVAVTGYQVFRCQGSGCTNFLQVGTASGTNFNDTGLAAVTSYSYQVRAVDAAGNQGPFSNSASATTKAAPSGLVAAYSFDGGAGTMAADASGNGNTGAIANAMWTSAGKDGGALYFNGVNADVNVPNSSSLQLTSGMTLEAWVNPSSVSSVWRDVIYKGDDSYYLEGTSDQSGAPGGEVTVAASKAHAYGAGTLATDTWSYLATTYDGAVLNLYVNGSLVGSQAASGAITSTANPLQIGGDSIYGQYFQGLIDDVRVYNRALSASQIQNDMNTAVTNGTSTSDTTSPSAPSGVGVSSAGQTSLSLSWLAATDNVGVAGYGVYRNGSLVASPTSTGYTLTGLGCGTSYMVAVDAFDAAGNRSAQATITTSTAACPDIQPPSAPGGLVASFVTQSAVTLSWSASSDNVGVVGYDLLLGGLVVGASAQTSFAFSGLSCNTAYTLGVDAYDAAGNRSTVSSLIVTTNACADTSPPSAPTNLAESAATSSSITAGWTASSDNVGVAGYRVFVDGSQAGTTTATSYSATGLSCGSSHQIVVDAFDAAGNRSPQTSATMATSSCPAPPPGDTTPPTTPTGLAVSSAAQTSLALSWTASSDNVGIVGYGVYKNSTLAASPTTTGYTLTGLTCGSSYTVAVDAYDAAGNRSAKATITTSTAACPDTVAPTAPSGITLATRTATSISISWTASSDNIGVAGYDLYRAGSAVGTATSTAYSFTGLTCGTNYTLAVDAYDAAGNHSTQATTAISTAACPDTSPPSTPTGLAASTVGQTSLTLSWNASTDNVGVTGYRLFVGGSQVGTGTITTYAFSGLACGTGYTLGVAAVDAAGNASSTATLSATTAACSSGTSANVFVSPSGSDSTCVRGDQAKPCLTFNKAYAISYPGDLIAIGAGSYSNQPAILPSSANGKPGTTPVTLQAVGTVTIDGGISLGSYGSSTSPSYITFDGNHETTTRNGGVQIDYVGSGSPASHVTIENTHLTGMSNDYHMIGAQDVSYLTIQGNDIGPACCGGVGSGDAIEIGIHNSGNPNNDHLSIIGNTIHDIYDSCNYVPAYIKSAYGCSGQGFGDGYSGSDHDDGMQIFGADTLTIANNQIYLQGDQLQSMFLQPANGGTFSNVTIENNMIRTTSAHHALCMCGPGTSVVSGYLKILYNTVIGNDRIGGEIAVYNGMVTSGTPVTIAGNIVNGGLGNENSSCSITAGNGSGLSVAYSHNLVVSGDSWTSGCGNGSVVSSTSFMSKDFPGSTPSSCADGSYSGCTTATGDPNLHLSGAQTAFDGGEATYCPATDIDGRTRPSGAACDMGANEAH